jgi:hypothetical protein
MSDAEVQVDEGRWCVLLPCSSSEHWAVPQNTLAEIVTLPADEEQPPEVLDWRGNSVPVLDFGDDDEAPWRERLSGTGLVAVFLGLEGENCDYWAVAVRGEGLAVRQISSEMLEDAGDVTVEHASSAFNLGGTVYQVPDLLALQRRIAANMDTA